MGALAREGRTVMCDKERTGRTQGKQEAHPKLCPPIVIKKVFGCYVTKMAYRVGALRAMDLRWDEGVTTALPGDVVSASMFQK